MNIIGSKEKPPVITPDVQLGDLMSSSFTRDYTQEKLHEKFARFEANSSNSEVETPEMVEAMIRFMPLRALRSFLGMSNEEIDTFCEGLKEHIKSQM